MKYYLLIIAIVVAGGAWSIYDTVQTASLTCQLQALNAPMIQEAQNQVVINGQATSTQAKDLSTSAQSC